MFSFSSERLYYQELGTGPVRPGRSSISTHKASLRTLPSAMQIYACIGSFLLWLEGKPCTNHEILGHSSQGGFRRGLDASIVQQMAVTEDQNSVSLAAVKEALNWEPGALQVCKWFPSHREWYNGTADAIGLYDPSKRDAKKLTPKSNIYVHIKSAEGPLTSVMRSPV